MALPMDELLALARKEQAPLNRASAYVVKSVERRKQGLGRPSKVVPKSKLSKATRSRNNDEQATGQLVLHLGFAGAQQLLELTSEKLIRGI